MQNSEIEITKAKTGDLSELMALFDHARKQMAQSGNPSQWAGYPTAAIIADDISKGNCYAIRRNGEICAVFTFVIGEDPTYRVIEGKWENDEEYGTVHRLASNGKLKGVFGLCLDFCSGKIHNIRADTHKDNKIMLHLFASYGFKRCGIIHVRDGSERIAYQKTIDCKDKK